VDRKDRRLKQCAVQLLNDRVIAPPPGNDCGRPFYLAVLDLDRDGWLDSMAEHHQERDRLRYLARRAKVVPLAGPEGPELNRLLLEVCYPEDVWEKAIVRRQNLVPAGDRGKGFVSLIDRDQARRVWWLKGSLGVFLVSALLVNLNHTSLHGFYRERLREAYLLPGGEGDLRLTGLDGTDRGAPYPLLNGTLERSPSLREWLFGTGPPRPAESSDGFLLSRRRCGSRGTSYRATADYLGGRLQLDDAMAVSAAAFSPARVREPLLVFLMTVLNLRLGQWLPNPRLGGPTRAPTVFRLLVDLWRRPRWRNHVFVTDGGHHENLGVGALLERRCRVLVVSDATCDSGYTCADLLRVCRRARLAGTRLQGPGAEGADALPLDLLRPSDGRSERHYLLAKVAYAGGGEGVLVYLKPTLTGDEASDLAGYAAAHGEFPHDETADQLFDADHVESYRQLGYHVGEGLCRDLEAAWGRPLGGEHLWQADVRLALALDELLGRWQWEQTWGRPPVPLPGQDALRVVLRRPGPGGDGRPTAVSTDGMEAAEAQALNDLVTQADFFNLPAKIGAAGPGALELTVATPQRRHTVRVAGPDVPAALRPLLDRLLAAAAWAEPGH
jgi:hypothetical protein